MKIHFNIRYFTEWGKRLLVTGNIPQLGNNDYSKALSLNFSNHEDWYAEIEVDYKKDTVIHYNFILLDEGTGKYTEEWGHKREIVLDKKADHLYCYDKWNSAGSYENAFMTTPFQEVLLDNQVSEENNTKDPVGYTHQFSVYAPLLEKHQALCIIGNSKEIGDWSINEPVWMNKTGYKWHKKIKFNQKQGDISYKYAIYDEQEKTFLFFEEGPDRIVPIISSKKTLVKKDDGFVKMNNTSWRGAGVCIPVFSIRTQKSFGVGDFADLKLLVDWANKVGLKLIQLLPLNDTNGTGTQADVLPYAAISAFALNPLFLNLKELGELPTNNHLQQQYTPKQAELNAQDLVPFMEVIRFKMEYAKEVFLTKKESFLKNTQFKKFLKENAYWLKSYAAYCVLKEKYHTNNYRHWEEYAQHDEKKIEAYVSPEQPHYDEVAFHYFVQYHLHKQLLEANKYAHKKGVILKGDIPIGVNKNSVDTWQHPELFHMDMNAGAPPDMFAIKGQNWELPTYNWQAIQNENFDWWKKRLNQMEKFFDTFRIDHILGFFRIWEIPNDQIEGIMGHLTPSIPIYINEFSEKGIWFDYNRFCKPYITDDILWDFFGEEMAWVKSNCLQIEDGWILRLKEEFQSQSYVEQLFEEGKISERVKWGLFDLISNVLFFEVKGSHGTQFYPRYGMHYLRSYADLDEHTKKGLDELYLHYYYHRQDGNWYFSGMEKLPALKRSTGMLVCGEDLGMMADCVTSVMNELGILSLEVQRAPKSDKIDFFHPNNAPYLSIVTPSTHDMSTIRGWWEEKREVTQKFYNTQLGHWGEAPYFCEWWIVRDIVLQHLYSPAMWSIFQMQDLLGISEQIRRENPHEERINDPSNSKSSWRYRMHIKLEDLLQQEEFNTELKNFIKQSGR